MMVDQMMFFQEWGVLTVLLLFVVMFMLADLLPRVRTFMKEIDAQFPQALLYLEQKQQYVIDCYERLPVRIRAGFAMIGGKRVWSWLVKAGYAYVRKNTKK
ncbi:hypothetical protein P4V54_09300 [Brevibacillus nitrificans]|uniref:hypothetical protein n=1 Tax=Brevibacillus nitrificans TaxID=651560 RepID=UPI002E1CB63D|nr:hypothetical protein [Brevibacillus nitrificans]